MYKWLALAGLTLLLLTPSLATASTLTPTQISAILNLLQSFGASSAVIQNVQAALSPGTAPASCISLTRSLSYGSRGDDVTKLQTFLNVSSTSYFGNLTQAALQKWQSAHNIVSSGTPLTTGWGVVGPKTRATMAQCTSTTQSSTTATTTATTTQSTGGGSSGGGSSGGGGGGGGSTSSPPTASFTINGSTNITLHVGDTANYAWSSTGGISYSLTYTQDSSNCGVSGTGPFNYWGKSTVPASYSEQDPITDCWAGHTYTLIFTATDSQGRKASAQATVTVPAVSGNLGDLWFSPNMNGASADWEQLFLNPSSWADARQKISVYQIGSDLFLAPEAESEFPDSKLSVLLQQIKLWNVGLSIEAGSVKPERCTGDITSQSTLFAIDRITRLGGSVNYINMDEPLYGGLFVKPSGKTCNFTQTQIAQQVNAYIVALKQYYPDVQIGEAEPWPYFSAATIEQWMDTLVAASSYPITSFWLDIDYSAIAAYGRSNSEIKQIADYVRAKGIPVRVIIWNSDFTAPQVLVTNDATEYAATMQFASTVHALTSVDGVILESWDSFPITTTPDSAPNTFTRLLKDYAAAYPPAKRTYPTPVRSYPRNEPPIGYLTGINSGIATGWAYDTDVSSQSINVAIYVDGPKGQGTLVATIPANILSTEVNAAYIITGNHGFSWQIPSQYLTASHSWYIYGLDNTDQNSAVLLIGSPKQY